MKYVLFGIIVVLLPYAAHAAVRITEVAWMGTASSSYSEWLELYNDGDSSVNLAGWKLYEGDGGTLVFTLTKSIPANGYLLIERTTGSAPDAVPGVNDEAGTFGGGGFANSGEDLVLKDASGSLIDELDYLDGWPAGDGTTKQTMQLSGDKWLTADATPKAPAEGNTSPSSSEDSTTVEEELEDDPYPIPKVSPNKPGIIFTVPSIVYTNTSYQFTAEPVLEYNYRINKGNIYWNFGDGTIVRQDEVAPFMHTYVYPGTYTMYYSYTDAITRVALTGTKKVKVVEPTLTVAVLGTTAIELTNTSAHPIDLSGWSVGVAGKSVAIPPMTIVSEKSKAVIPLRALSITNASSVHILDPSGNLVAATDKSAAPQDSPVVYSQESSDEESFISTEDLVANATDIETKEKSATPIQNRTKTIIFGAISLFVIGLSILLERVMARREYS